MATSPYPFPFHSAASYPPPIFPGGYYPPPFPYTSSSYPAPAYAPSFPPPSSPPASSPTPPGSIPPSPPTSPAPTYPYPAPFLPNPFYPVHEPPPASAYAPPPAPSSTPWRPPQIHGDLADAAIDDLASFSPPFSAACTYPPPPPGFFQAPAYGPSITTSPFPNQPPPVPASSEFSGDLSSRSPLCSRPRWQQFKEEGGRPKLKPLSAEPAATAPVHRPHAAIDALTPLLELQQEEGMKTKDGATPSYDYAKTGSDALPMLPDYTCQGCGLTKHNSTSSSEILSVPEPSPAFDLEKSNDWHPEFQQGATSDSIASHVFDQRPLPGYTHQLFGKRPTPGIWNASYMCSTPIPCSCVQDYTLELATPAMENVCGRAPSSIATPAASLGPGLGSNENDKAGSDLMLVHNVQLPLPMQDCSDMYKKMPLYDMYEEEKLENEQTSKYLRKASENKTHSSQSHMSAIAAELMQFQAFELLPVFDVYDDETDDCSNELIPMFTDTPEQLTAEEEKSKSHQTFECFSKPTFSSVRPTAGTVSLFILTNEQSICDFEKLKDGGNLLFAKQEIEQLLYGSSQVYKCRTCDEESQGDEKILWDKSVCRTATEHSVLFFLWDPGALLPLMPRKAQHSSSSVTRFSECSCLPFRVQNSMYLLWKSESGMTIYISWDPGIMHILYMMLDKYTVPNSVQFIKWTSEILFLSLPVYVQYMVQNGINSVLHAMSFILRRAAYLSQEVNAADVLVLAAACFTCKHSLFMANEGNSRTNHSFLKLFMQFLREATTLKVRTQKKYLDFLSIGEMLPDCSEFRDGQLPYISEGTSIHSPKWVGHTITVLSRWFFSFEMAKLQWDPGIGKTPPIYLYLQGCNARIEPEKPLFWLPIQEPTKWQIQMTTVSFVWDPGNMLLWYKFKWWLLFAEEKINRYQDIKINGIALWQITFNPP